MCCMGLKTNTGVAYIVHACHYIDRHALCLQGEDSGLLVRRKGRAMPEELGRGGQQAEHIDWRKSVLLNLVIQATYCLTVATCRHAAGSAFTC